MITNSQPVYVFLHIQKCGGTTLIKHIEKNFSANERVKFTPELIGVDISKAKYKDFLKAATKVIESMPYWKKAKIKVIYGHFVPYGLAKILGKEVRYVTFLRNPVDRVFSFYDHYKTLYDKECPEVRDGKRFYTYGFLVNGKEPDFVKWFNTKLNNKNVQFSLTTIPMYLKLLGYLKGSVSSRSTLTKTLNKFYFVGLSDQGVSDIFYFYSLLGIRKYFVNQNVSVSYVNRRSSKLRKLVSDKVRNGKVLYALALRIHSNFRNENKNFTDSVEAVRRARIVLPVTQVVFDFRETVGLVSSKLRKIIPGYGTVLDFLKAKC